MKSLPRLMENSSLSIQIESEQMWPLTITIQGARNWPLTAHWDKENGWLQVFDTEGQLIYDHSCVRTPYKMMEHFGLQFVGVTESRVNFAPKSQYIEAKMRAVDLYTHDNLTNDIGEYEE